MAKQLLTTKSKLTKTSHVAKEDLNESLFKTIGNTPLLEFSKLNDQFGLNPNVTIFAKAEWYNAGGSVKSRAALNMILEGEKSGLLKPGITILDSTSGNTGVAYALIGLIKGYHVKIVMPQNVCGERKQLMSSSYHAEIVYSSPFEGSDGAIKLCEEIYQQNPKSYFWPDQYNNDANWRAHYNSTATEIWEQTGHKVTHFLAGLGTTGTIMGVSRGLKERFNSDIKAFAVEPAESLHGIEGLKHMPSSIVPKIYRPDELDGKISVTTDQAYKMVGLIYELYNINIGSSSGAALAAAVELASTLDQDATIVTVLPDSCDCEFTSGG
ncbi:MAG: PLP-dependent cysteine synthase family protein [Nitrospinota bacterium]